MTTFSWLPLTSLTSLVVILGEILQGKFREVCHVNDMSRHVTGQASKGDEFLSPLPTVEGGWGRGVNEATRSSYSKNHHPHPGPPPSQGEGAEKLLSHVRVKVQRRIDFHKDQENRFLGECPSS
jgi:hypothetical protein